MTKQERLKAFEMRLDGCKWIEIARALGYTSTTVKQDLQGCVLSKPYQINCVYPAIRRIITDRYDGSIRALADACGITYNAMYYTMSGKCPVSAQRKKIISNVLGIPPEEAFQREEDD